MNNFAVSSDGLATALQDSASSLKAGGNSLEQSVALIAAANKVLQDPNSVGSALRTISLRIRGTSAKELEALGEETDGAIQSTSKLRSKVKGLTGGVDILTDSGAYKDTYTIIKEIATVWEDMSDIDQAALLELLAGKNRSNAMAAMLTNMEDLTDAYDTAMHADGSALRENEKYLDSIQGRIDIFQNAVQTFWMDFINSDAVKFIVDLGTAGVNFLDTWYGKLITIGGVVDHYGLQLIPKLFKKLKVKDFLKGLWDNSALKKIGKDAIFAFQKEIVNSKFKINFKDVINTQSLKNAIDGLEIDNNIKSKLGETLFSNGEDGGLNLSDSIASIDEFKQALLDAGIAEEDATLILAAANEQLAQTTLDTVIAEIGAKDVLELTSAEKLKNAIATQTGNAELAESIVLTEANAAGEAELTVAQEANTVAKLRGVLAEQGLNAEKIEAIMLDAGLITANAGVTASIKGIGAAIKKVLAEIGPIGWIILAIGAIVAAVQALRKTSEDYEETLDDINSQIDDTTSQIQSLNDELQTTKERIAELLGQGPLTLVEDEELKKLQLRNAELERQLQLQKTILETQKKQRIKAAKDVIDSKFKTKGAVAEFFSDRDYAIGDNGEIIEDDWLHMGGSGTDVLDVSLTNYKNVKKVVDGYKLALSALEKGQTYEQYVSQADSHAATVVSESDYEGDYEDLYDDLQAKQGQLDDIAAGISMVLSDMSDVIAENELSYSLGDKEIDQFLDQYYAYMQKWSQVQGLSTKSDAIGMIFDDSSSDALKNLKGQLDEIAQSSDDAFDKQIQAQDLIQKALDSTDEGYDRLRTSMETIGLTAEDVASYFVNGHSLIDPNSIEGIIAQYAKGEEILTKFKDSVKGVINYIDEAGVTREARWDDLFIIDEDGKAVAQIDEIAKVLGPSTEEARNQFAQLVEAVAEGSMEFTEAIDRFGLEGMLAISDIQLSNLADQTADVFGDIKDNIDGVIDTFGELNAALQSTADSMDLVKQAQEEMNSTGRVSVKTALEIMESTDRWDEVLTINSDSIKLNANAQSILNNIKLETMKADVDAALTNAQYQLALLEGADASLLAGEAEITNASAGEIYQNAMRTNTALTAGFSAALGQLVSNLQNWSSPGQWSSVIGAFNSAYNAALDSIDIGNEEAADALRTQIRDLKAQKDALSQLSNVGDITGSVGGYGDRSGSGSGSDSDSLLDWLEHYYEDIENKIEELNAELENVIDNTGGIDAKNTILDQIINLYDQKMQKLANAEATYRKRAETLFNSFGADIQQRILNGSLDIQTISNSDLASDIDKYYEYAQAASEARVQMEELANTIADTAKQKFDSINDAYNSELELNQSVVDSLEKQVDLLEERGEQVGTNLYSAMIDQYTVRGQLLQQQRQDLQNMLDTEVKMGHVKVGSEQWFEMVGTINELDDEIVDLSISVEECQNAINDIKWDNFDKLISRFEELNKQLDFLFDRFTDDDGAFDEDGNWTDRGIAAIGILTQKMELAQKTAAEYSEALEQLEKDYKSGRYSEEEYFEKQSELTEGQRDAIQNYEDIKDSIVDLNKTRIDAIKDSMSKELDAYKKLVDKTKELLNAEKELYNFEKNINAKKKNITLLEKQIAALTGSNSAEDIARRIKLQAELNEARQELDDDYYEHSMDMTTEALDKEVEYRERQNDKIGREYDEWLKDREAVVAESFTLVQNNATKVLQEIQRVSAEYGTPIAEEIIRPWEDGSQAIADYRNQFINPEMVGAIDSFKSMLDDISSKWDESAVAAEEAAKRAAQAVAQQEKDVIAAQNRMVDNAKKAAQEVGNMNNVFSTSSNNDSSNGYVYSGGNLRSQPYMEKSKKLGGDRKIAVGGTTKSVRLNNKDYIPYTGTDGVKYYLKMDDGEWIKGAGSSQGGWMTFEKGTQLYKYHQYAKGTLGTPKSDWSIIDELGEELVLNAGPNGRLQYLTKGTSVVPADITQRLMDIALDPTEVLERSRPRANANLSVASNIELNLSIAEVVHIDHADSDAIPDISKAVKTQMDKYMASINNNLKKYTR